MGRQCLWKVKWLLLFVDWIHTEAVNTNYWMSDQYKKAFFYSSNKTVGQFVCVKSLYFVSSIPSKQSTVPICSLTNVSLLVIVVIYLADPVVSLRSLPMPLKSKEILILFGTRSRFGHSACPWGKAKLTRRLMLSGFFDCIMMPTSKTGKVFGLHWNGKCTCLF